MRKIFVFAITIFLFSFSGLFFSNETYATCQINVQPSTVPKDFNDNITITGPDGCLSKETSYQVVAYPQTISSLKKAYDTVQGNQQQPVTSDEVRSPDGKTLVANLNFNAIITRLGLGSWNLLVCLPEDIDNKSCDKHPVGRGTIIVASLAPTPTPTPQSDQPIMLRTDQDTCTFQVSYDPNSFITIRAENIDPSKTYVRWWDNDYKKNISADLTPITQDTPSFTTTPSSSPTPPLYELKIPKNELQNLKNLKQEDGHLLCIDISGLQNKRTGANCQRLFFTPDPPEGNTACTETNSGEVTPAPKPRLPPCANWVYLDNASVPTPEPTGTQEEYIRQNNLRSQIKCESVSTGLGNIKTDPFQLVKSIMSVMLSLAGGIAVILIIISGYRLMTSQGNPEAVQGAREQLTSAIVGFLFIIFSLVILQVIGVDILHIPGFEK